MQATHSQHGWRFVNKYTNRSNGGIPMFSEERSKERAEKVSKLLNRQIIPPVYIT